MIPMLIPILFAYLIGNDETPGRTLFEFILDKSEDFIAIVEEFFTPFFRMVLNFFVWAYEISIGSFFDFVLYLIENSKNSFVYNGKIFISTLFDKLSFDSTYFTENFIYFFIGLVLFALVAKVLFKVIINLFGMIIDLLLKLV